MHLSDLRGRKNSRISLASLVRTAIGPLDGAPLHRIQVRSGIS